VLRHTVTHPSPVTTVRSHSLERLHDILVLMNSNAEPVCFLSEGVVIVDGCRQASGIDAYQVNRTSLVLHIILDKDSWK